MSNGINKRPFFAHYKKIFVNEFRGYNATKLINDITAGITVGAVALPLALAFGAASVDSAHVALGIAAGLITAIVAGIISGALGGGSFQISGPTGAMTVVLGTIVAGKYGISGMFLATFISGLILLLSGFARCGKLVQFIPRPVVVGFTSGIALVIAIGQLGNGFGFAVKGETTIDKVLYFFGNLGQTNWINLAFTLLVVAIMIFYPRKWSKYLPGSLVAIILTTIIVNLFGISVNKIGAIPRSIINTEVLNISKIDVEMIKAVFSYSITIALLGMVESLLCGTCAATMKKEKFDSNVELIAQGAANMLVPFFGGVPSTAAIARTSVAIKSGGVTRITSIVQSIFLILCVFILAPIIGMVPYCALAGVLFVTAFKMNDFKTIKMYMNHKLYDALLLFFVTMFSTVMFDLTYAIIIGVVLSLIIMISELSKIKVTVKEEEKLKTQNACVVYSVGAYFFANGKELLKAITKCDKKYDTYILSFRGVVFVDVTAAEEFLEAVNFIKTQGSDFCFVDVGQGIYNNLEKIGFVSDIGKEKFYDSLVDYVMKDSND